MTQQCIALKTTGVYLSRDNYEMIQASMLGFDDTSHGDLPSSALADLFAPDLKIRRLSDLNESFTRQILDSVGQTDVYLMTNKSAVPVADAVRGYYEAMGLPLPLIDTIYANRLRSRNYFAGCGNEHLDKESARLRPLVEGADHVCVVDQFVNSGRTLNYAAQILSACGITQGSAMRGNWYDEATEVDSVGVSSVHESFMLNVGRLAAVINS